MHLKITFNSKSKSWAKARESSDEVSVTFYGADIVMFLYDLSMPLFAKVPHLTTVNS
jgi:hypothetical protein